MKGTYVVFVGSSCIDEYYEMEEVPALGEKVNCIAKESVVGGMIGNAAAVHASYGAETFCIDYLNHSAQSEAIISDMKKSGIDISTIQRDDTLPDPRCLIMLYGGERIIFVVANFKKDLELNQLQHSVLQEAKFVYSSITEMISYNNCMEITEEFKRKGAKLV
ncbi:MAG: carbohydrate kinase family protein, partial [Sporomusa sp.]